MSPAASTATPVGPLTLNPVTGTVVCAPPPAGSSTTLWLPVSAINTSPAASNVTAYGEDSPVPNVVCAPPAGGTTTTRLLPSSAIKTSPPLSTATPYGSTSPVAGSVVCAPAKVTAVWDWAFVFGRKASARIANWSFLSEKRRTAPRHRLQPEISFTLLILVSLIQPQPHLKSSTVP